MSDQDDIQEMGPIDWLLIEFDAIEAELER